MSTRSSLTAETYQRLRADVLACRLVPGQLEHRGVESSLLGRAEGSVREALSRLTSEGFVIAEPQRGFRVAPISESGFARPDVRSRADRGPVPAQLGCGRFGAMGVRLDCGISRVVTYARSRGERSRSGERRLGVGSCPLPRGACRRLRQCLAASTATASLRSVRALSQIVSAPCTGRAQRRSGASKDHGLRPGS